MRVAYLGLPLGGLLLAGDGHVIVYAGLVRGVGLRRLGARFPFVAVQPDLEDDAAVARLRDARPELLVSWFWTKRVPARVLALAPAVGVHPSLLPRHRGPDPYFWAIDAGDEVTGVTAHRLDEEYDTGATLGRRELRVDPTWDAWRLARALDRPSLALLRATVAEIAEGRAPVAEPQPATGVTLAPAPTDDDLALRWSWPAARLERRVRAAAPWPGAWTEIGDEGVVLTRVRVTGDFPRVLAPGEAAVRRDGVAVVRAADAALELLEGRAEEDEASLDAAALAEVVRRAQG